MHFTTKSIIFAPKYCNITSVKKVKNYLFKSTVIVREWETDMQGVVNNAHYHNLLQQTRIEFLSSIGIDVRQWSLERDIDFVVYETSIQYRRPVIPGETFVSGLNLRREGVRFVYTQELRREDGTLCIKARIDVVIGYKGKLTRGDVFADYLRNRIILTESEGKTLHASGDLTQPMSKVLFDYEMKVRDYQCDRYGSATNAFVQHYLEEARLEYMEELGTTFRAWHENGIDLMVSQMDLQFLQPMKSSEKFHSLLNVYQEGPRLTFFQEIRRKEDYRLCVRGKCDVVALVNGELSDGSVFEDFIAQCKRNGSLQAGGNKSE